MTPVPATFTVGVDLGGTKCLGLVADEAGNVLAVHRRPTPRGAPAVVAAVVEVVDELRRQVPGVAAVGVGAPGLASREGVLRFAPNLPGVTELDLGRLLGEALGLPVVVDNDATCAAWAERQTGAGRGSDDVVVVTLGTGIGAGIVVNGILCRGANGFAGEVGHMVVDPHGPRCPCGRRGCWERFASGSGLGRLGREAAHAGQAARVVELAGGDPEAVRGEHVTRAAAHGDAEALAVVSSFAWWLALGLANLANLLDPELFVVGGGLVLAGDLLLGPTRQAFATLVEAPDHRPPIRIEGALLGERAGALGAAQLAVARAAT